MHEASSSALSFAMPTTLGFGVSHFLTWFFAGDSCIETVQLQLVLTHNTCCLIAGKSCNSGKMQCCACHTLLPSVAMSCSSGTVLVTPYLPVQEGAAVLGQWGAGLHAVPRSSPGLPHRHQCLLPAHHHAHGAATRLCCPHLPAPL